MTVSSQPQAVLDDQFNQHYVNSAASMSIIEILCHILFIWFTMAAALANESNGTSIHDKLVSIYHNLVHSANRRMLISDINTTLYLHGIRDQVLPTDANRDNYHPTDDLISLNYKRFESGYYRYLTGDLPVIVMLFGISARRLGNEKGRFLPNLACAHLSHLHIIYLDLFSFDGLGFNKNHHDYRHGADFFDSFPTIIESFHPADNYETAKQAYKHHGCDNLARDWYPWESSNYPITTYITFWRPLVAYALNNQMNNTELIRKTNTTLYIESQVNIPSITLGRDDPNLRETMSTEELAHLPEFPDVTIHWRCSDNILFNKMGLIPFPVIIRYIPSHVKYIFIVSDFDRLGQPITYALKKEIEIHRPGATVVIRHHGDPFLALWMFLNSKIVICGASTFCFHFAVANTKGVVYLPMSDISYGIKTEFRCCGHHPNVFVMNDSYPISTYYMSNGTKIEKPTAEFMIEVLKQLPK